MIMSRTNGSTMQVHRKQFVIGPDVFPERDDWRCRSIGPNVSLSHCPELRVDHVGDADGARWALLGFAVETDESSGEPRSQIARTPTVGVPMLYESWAGRWVLVGGGQLHMDAGGLLGCFYGRDAEDRIWISSSPALLRQILASTLDLSADPRQLRYRRGLYWFTPPRSRFENMRRLLPSQALDLSTGLERHRPLMPPIDPTRDLEEVLALIERKLTVILERLAREEQPLWLGLSGGFDSRLMLAIARRAGLDIKTFTRVTSRMSVADRVLPPRLARQAGYPHIFVRQSSKETVRAKIVAEHTAGHVSDGDAQPFLQGVRDGLAGISFGGHGFSVASGFRNLAILPATISDPVGGARLIAELFKESVSSGAIAGIQDWLTWAIDHPQAHLDWRDRFFIEQRQAGWLSSKEQLYDLTPLERFAVLNASQMHALLLGLPADRRVGSRSQAELIRRLAPDLLKEPFNPPDKGFSAYRRVMIKLADDPSSLVRIAQRRLHSRQKAAS